MNLLFRSPSASGRTEPPTRQIRRRKPAMETLEPRALLASGCSAPSSLVAPALAQSSPAIVTPAWQVQISDTGEVELRHAVAD
jgi:hypothetical protein